MAQSPDPAVGPLARRALAAGTLVAAVGAATLVLVNTLNVLVLDNRFAQFAASEERTAFTWAASSAAFAVAFVAALHVVAGLGDARVYGATAAVVAFFSLDDAIEIHERLGDRVAEILEPPEAAENRVWMFLYAPLLAAAFALLWLVIRRMAEPMRRYALVGVALLLVGVLLEGVGIVTNELAEEGSDTPHRLRAGIEEAAELAGWILVAAALTAALFDRVTGGQWQRPEPSSVNEPGAAGTNRQS